MSQRIILLNDATSRCRIFAQKHLSHQANTNSNCTSDTIHHCHEPYVPGTTSIASWALMSGALALSLVCDSSSSLRTKYARDAFEVIIFYESGNRVQFLVCVLVLTSRCIVGRLLNNMKCQHFLCCFRNTECRHKPKFTLVSHRQLTGQYNTKSYNDMSVSASCIKYCVNDSVTQLHEVCKRITEIRDIAVAVINRAFLFKRVCMRRTVAAQSSMLTSLAIR